jgi:hypothetical protein
MTLISLLLIHLRLLVLLQEACVAAGVPVSLLSGSEVNSSCRQLTLPPHRAAGLLQGDGGVLRATTAAAAARQLAAKEGVLMRVSGPGCRQQRRLRTSSLNPYGRHM